MIYKDGKQLLSIAYFDQNGARKIIDRIFAASADGSLRLVWKNSAFLIIDPVFLWVTEVESTITVRSNVDWTVN